MTASGLVSRLVQLVPVLLGVTTLAFLLMRITPGDPAQLYLGQKAGPAALDALRHSWGLDRPVWQQYLGFLGGIVRGDLGDSMYFREPVTALIATRLPVTLTLVAMTTALMTVITVPAATVAASRKNGWADSSMQIAAAVAFGMPQFWLANILVLTLALGTGLFPVAGVGGTPGTFVVSLLLPSLTLAICTAPLVFRSLRTAMIEALDSDYVAFARSKGLGERVVMTSYVLRNATVQAVTVLGIAIGGMLGGTLVVENVFNLPGLGGLMMQAILNRDFPLVQGVTLVFGVFVVVVYLLTDLAYRLVDPRVSAA